MKSSNVDLTKCTVKAFDDFLSNGIESMNENSIINFFNTCINYLNNDKISIASKYKIIYSLEKSLSSQAKIELFINGNYLSQLPFKLFNAQEKILDIVYIITNYAPNGIKDSVAIKFGHLITRFPRKCLNILSLFSERFQVTLNPWKMIDRLFIYCDTFIDQTCVDDYISILCYLNAKFPSFRENRIKHTWSAFSQIIKKCEIDFSKAKAYYAMCQLYELRPRIIKNCPFPETAPDDLSNPNLQKAVISLLLRCSPNQIEEPTIKALFQIKNKSCFLALSQLAENHECAKVLSNDLSWLQDEIPTAEGTMQIFAKLLKSPYIRIELAKSPEVVTYFNNIINNGKEPENVENQSLTTVSTFIRSLPINSRFVGYISNEDLLSNYFNAALPRTEKSVVDSTLSLINAVSKRGDAGELSDVCDYVKENVLSNNPIASEAAVNLARYPRCAKEFKKNGLANYFEKNPNNSNSKEFLTNYKKSIKLPVRNPTIVSSLPDKKPLSLNSQLKPSKNTSQLKQSPTRRQRQEKEEIKTRSIVLPEPEPEKNKFNKESESEKEPEPEKKQESESESESYHKPLKRNEQKSKQKKKSESESEEEPEPEPEPETKSESDSDLKSKNNNDENEILSENSTLSANDSSFLKKSNNDQPSKEPTPIQSPSSAVRSSIISSPSASGVYDPYISPSKRKVANSPLSKPKSDEEESEKSTKSDLNEQFTSSILKNRANDSDDSASETENINPSISPIKQKTAVPASPLNKSKIRGIASFGSFGSISDGDEIKKSPSKISVDLPPPEQNTQNLLPDAIGGLTYIKQGSPPPKPRPKRNRE